MCKTNVLFENCECKKSFLYLRCLIGNIKCYNLLHEIKKTENYETYMKESS